MNRIITTAVMLALSATMFAQSDRVQCSDTTKTNTRCKNLAIIGRNLCWQHDSTHVKPIVLEAIRCTGITGNNTQCKNKTRHESGKCHHHRN